MNKQEVRKNRDRIRQNMRVYLTLTEKQNSQKNLNSQKNYTPQTVFRARKKSSEDIRALDDVSFMKEFYLQNSFENLFELLQKIGEGAHAVVFRCREIKTDKIFAVKMFKLFQPQNLRQLKDHYRIKKSLSHENIIKAYNLFINEKLKKIHMICEYCPDQNLRQYINRNKQFTESKIATIIHGITSAVAYMHKHGVCHRDIKPENIVYNEKSNQLKLIDFQIAKMCKYTNQRLEMWTNTGTLHYKAPEMFRGCYNELIDVWAIGVIAYELAYGKLPFEKEYVNEIIHAICEEEPDYESEEVSLCLQQFIKRCLVKNPLKRTTSAQALQSPFFLKFMETSSANSPKMKRKSTPQTDSEQQQIDEDLKVDITNFPRTSYSEEDLINQKGTFSEDIGIRFLNH